MTRVDIPDFRTVAAEILRSLRGKHSQAWMLRRLGKTHNAIYRWEHRRRRIPWNDYLEFAAICRLDPIVIIKEMLDLPSGCRTIAEIFCALGVPTIATEIAKRVGLSSRTICAYSRGSGIPMLDTVLAVLWHIDPLTMVNTAIALADSQALTSLTPHSSILTDYNACEQVYPLTPMVYLSQHIAEPDQPVFRVDRGEYPLPLNSTVDEHNISELREKMEWVHRRSPLFPGRVVTLRDAPLNKFFCGLIRDLPISSDPVEDSARNRLQYFIFPVDIATNQRIQEEINATAAEISATLQISTEDPTQLSFCTLGSFRLSDLSEAPLAGYPISQHYHRDPHHFAECAFLGRLLRHLRGSRSQKVFAAELGIDNHIVHRWENGTRPLLWTEFCACCALVGIDLQRSLWQAFLYRGDVRDGQALIDHFGIGNIEQSPGACQRGRNDKREHRLHLQDVLHHAAEHYPGMVLLWLREIAGTGFLDDDIRAMGIFTELCLEYPFLPALLHLVQAMPNQKIIDCPGCLAKMLGISAVEERAALNALSGNGLMILEGEEYRLRLPYLTDVYDKKIKRALMWYWTHRYAGLIGQPAQTSDRMLNCRTFLAVGSRTSAERSVYRLRRLCRDLRMLVMQQRNPPDLLLVQIAVWLDLQHFENA